MSKTVIQRSVSSASDSLTQGGTALIASCAARATIAAVLQREKLAFDPFDDLEDLLKLTPAYSPSLILLWVADAAAELPGRIEQLVQNRARRPIVVICPSIEGWGVRTALTTGAVGVVLSTDLDSALGPCVRAVLVGQTCVPRLYGRQIEPPALSTREKQILGLVVMGYMNREIAQQLFVAESTVKSHLSSAFGKLGVRSRNDAVSLILDSSRGLGMGILALGGEPLETAPATK